MKKIGFFALHYDPPIGGAERSMHNYFKALAKDFEIKVFCFLQENGTKFLKDEIVEKDGITIRHSSKPINVALARFLKTEKPDLVCTQLFKSDIVVRLCSVHRVPVYYFVHGFFEDICPHYLLHSCEYDNLLTCNFGKHCPNHVNHVNSFLKYNQCKKIFFNSEYTKEVFNRFFPEIEDDKTDIIYPNLEYDIFYNKEERERDKKLILAVNSRPTKGRIVIEGLAQANPEINIIYVCCDSETKNLFRKYKNIRTFGNVSRDKMFELYKSVGAVICPTFMQETFGGVVAEAVLSQTPVVCMNKGNLNNLVCDGQNGFLLDSPDINLWSSKIKEAVNLKMDKKYSSELYNRINSEKMVSNLKFHFLDREEQCEEGDVERKKKRILFFARFFYPPLGGGEFFILSILKYLQSKGYECIGAGYCDPATNLSFAPNDIGSCEWDGIEAHKLSIRHHNDIRRFFIKIKPDLIITHSYDAKVFISIAKNMGIKTILGTHFWRNICSVPDNFINMLERGPETYRLLKDNHKVFDLADELYVNSEFMQLGVERYVGKRIDRVIHPLLDKERVISADRDLETAKYVTLINPDKGKGGEIFLQLAKRMKDISFLCVGLGSEISMENKLINDEIKKQSNIRLIEKTDKISDVYKITRILLIPSLVDETFSMVGLEAMSNGIPILVTPYGNLRFLVEDGGYILDPNKIEDWEEKIRGLFVDRQAYDDIGNKAKKVSEKYEPEIELRRFEEMVVRCIGESE